MAERAQAVLGQAGGVGEGTLQTFCQLDSPASWARGQAEGLAAVRVRDDHSERDGGGASLRRAAACEPEEVRARRGGAGGMAEVFDDRHILRVRPDKAVGMAGAAQAQR
eukprot:1226393-Pleurochrysis_carterae.AAC.1